MAQKKLIQGQPKFNDTSQYNFDDTTADFNYDNSSGLPKNNDKFQNKDLYTTAYGSNLNNAIMDIITSWLIVLEYIIKMRMDFLFG